MSCLRGGGGSEGWKERESIWSGVRKEEGGSDGLKERGSMRGGGKGEECGRVEAKEGAC